MQKRSVLQSILVMIGVLSGLLAALGVWWYEKQLPPVPSLKKRKEKHFPYALLLGCSPHDDGSPSRSMLGRCELAVKLYKEGLYDTLVLSGGSVRNRFVEARSMEKVVHELDPSIPVLLECHARNTWQNMENTKAMIGDAPVLVITGGLHSRRASAIARQFFSDYATAGYPDFTWKRARREAASRLLYLWIELKKACPWLHAKKKAASE